MPHNPVARRRRTSRPLTLSFALLATLLVLLVVPTSRDGAGGAVRGPLGPASATVVGLGASPPPTAYGAMSYDPAMGAVILFGGQDVDGVPIATTWEFRNGNWTNLTPGLGESPPARWGASFTYDASSSALLLFGGCSDENCHPAYGDTWEFVNDGWTDLTPGLSVSPSARGYASMTYDAADGVALLFGGYAQNGSAYPDNDTWSFANGTWSEVAFAPSELRPAARYDALLQYDPVSHTTVLFGGVGADADLGDTWTYHAGAWTELNLAGSSPSARHGTGSCFDAADGYVFLLGGDSDGGSTSDAWSFNGSAWLPLTVSGGPAAGYGSQVTYDASAGYVLWFSGIAKPGSLYVSTASYVHGTWTLLLTPQASGASVLSQVSVFLIFLVFTALLQLVVVLTTWRQNRQDASDGFALPPGAVVPWIETGSKSAPGAYAVAILPVMMLAIFLPFMIGIAASLSGGLAVVGVLLIVSPIVVLDVVLVWWGLRVRRVFAVAVLPEGVAVRRGSAVLRLPWDYVRPSNSVMSPKAGWFNFRYGTPKKPTPERWITLTTEQARSVILSPYAPRWNLPPIAARMLGVPSTAAPAGGTFAIPPSSPGGATAPGPIAAYPAPPPAAGTANVTVGGVAYGAPGPQGPPMAPPPPPPPPTYVYVPTPPPSPPPPVARSPPPPVAPPLVSTPQIRCPGCGGRYPEFAYAFCPTCGTRLR